MRTQALQAQNTKKLYSHQVETFEQFNEKLLPPRRAKTSSLNRSNAEELLGNHIIITNFFRKESLLQSLRLRSHIEEQRQSNRALCLFPLKALINDQVAKMTKLNKFRDKPPDILITNPDILHFQMYRGRFNQPGWENWRLFLTRLKVVVLVCSFDH